MKKALNSIKSRISYSNKFYAFDSLLCYHSVENENKLIYKKGIHNVTPEFFELQLKKLKKYYSILPLNEFLYAKSRGKKRIAAITFDDAYKNVVIKAIPVLEYYKLPYTIFVNSKIFEKKMLWRDKVRYIINSNLIIDFREFLDSENGLLFSDFFWDNFYSETKRKNINSKILEEVIDKYIKIEFDENLYLNIDEIKKLPKKCTIGNHSHSHYNLASLSKEDQFVEINSCHQNLQMIRGFVNIFAIPFGGYDTFNQDTLDILNDLGYNSFIMTNQNRFQKKDIKFPFNSHSLLYSNRILPSNENLKLIY